MQKDLIFSVSEINEYIKMVLESSPQLRDVWLRGEISNFKSNFSSGHLYFSLKDANSSIKAVMFRGYSQRLKFRPESGMKVVVHGKISTYTVSGDYQIIIDDMQPDGVGALAIAFEQLKAKLESEGLFSPERKKPIPKFVRSVGVITSASGAALHDIINVSGRRCPSAEIIVYPAYVQGELAPRSLTSGILFFNNRHNVDLIIIGRGGGSMEDLWGFNDEGLARAIADSHIPVISAVGHETDFTICDFVADKRAPTPSAAAELAFPDTKEMLLHFDHLLHRCTAALSRVISGLDGRFELARSNIERYSPINRLKERSARLELLRERLDTLINERYGISESAFKLACARLEGVNPLAVLARGYSAVENERGEIVSSTQELSVGDKIKVRLSDGTLDAVVDKIDEKRGQI